LITFTGSPWRSGRSAAVLSAVALGVGAVLAMTPPAGASSVPAHPLVHGPSSGTAAGSIGSAADSGGGPATFNAVSCTSASACTAVGYYPSSAGGLPLAERWNGTAWAIQKIPGSGSLAGVSCTSASACIAVGGSLAERWNGTAWAIQKIPQPSGGGSLGGVSCTSASACTAVGSSNGATLAERWNGTAWTIQKTANPSGTGGSGLDAVSCSSASACTAVGNSSGGTLAESWNGTSWAIQQTPNPSGGTDGLDGVSCTSASACIAVANTPAASYIVAEQWNGTAWVIQDMPNPSGVDSIFVTGVSCTSASACTAAGNYFLDSGTQYVLAERWNGTAWVIQPTASPSGQGFLNGVSCASASACTAVGYYLPNSVTLAEYWDGTAWVVQPTPNPSPPPVNSNSLSGVSCTWASACTAVGSSNGATLAERWNGKAWVVQKTPNEGGMAGVSCPSASACAAVGSNGVTVAERWNGKAWAIEPTPTPGGEVNGALNGVSCVSASACSAIGWYDTTEGGTLSLADYWNGTAWAIQPTPNPGGSGGSNGAANNLNGVSCTSASACTAVGYYFSTFVTSPATLAARWNGTAWDVQPTPNPGGTGGPPNQENTLNGVSCTSASACTAVGSYNAGGTVSNPNGTTLLLAVRWNGKTWAVQSTPSPSGAQGSSLAGVSCTSASACIAVGSYTNSAGTTVPLAERWNGKAWTIQKTPIPSGALGSSLAGVSCRCGICIAVGSYSTSTGAQMTLAERWNGKAWVIQKTPNPSGT
jgi:hypothetical protein